MNLRPHHQGRGQDQERERQPPLHTLYDNSIRGKVAPYAHEKARQALRFARPHHKTLAAQPTTAITDTTAEAASSPNNKSRKGLRQRALQQVGKDPGDEYIKERGSAEGKWSHKNIRKHHQRQGCHHQQRQQRSSVPEIAAAPAGKDTPPAQSR